MNSARALFDRPVFIVSSPRSGSSLLFLTLAGAPGVFTIGGESHQLIEGIPGLHPYQRGWASNALAATDATPQLTEELSRRFYGTVRDRDGRGPAGQVRLLEKTPKNSLRIPFLAAAFPDAIFVYLYRDVRETLASMIEAWKSGRFVTYPRLPDWPGTQWSLLLTPGWRDLAGLPLPEIVARQWAAATNILLDDLATIPRERVKALSYADFLAAPEAAMRKLAASLDLGWDRELAATLPHSPTVVSPPRPDKWRDNETAIDGIWTLVAEVDARARAQLSNLS